MRVLILLAVFLFGSTSYAFAESTFTNMSDAPQMSQMYDGASDIERLELADHSNDGVLTREFRGQGRCSQVCPIMQEIGRAHCSSIGRCWCDERSGGLTIGHLICN